ncbi:pre-rRNA-processing protein TSR4 [Blastomyces parvus]|uniref:Pre-rRNA-processing protein TSR4 n=1 Tax=Blastomyces parvus TaxID=2060905 RepID=A0A2B7WLK7_9EURO|nr:pre-rRNA-processing protein TSR4 [Blastomyces parvus]
MDQYDSDSSGIDDFTETNVLLGYADDNGSDDSISHLGGWPTWLDPATPPPGDFARCKVCNNPMLLLLQLNGDLPEHFPHDERWLYIFGCPRKSCTRKNGSIRALRGVKKHKVANSSSRQQQNNQPEKTGNASEPTPAEAESKPKQDLGSSLFGAAPSTQGQSANPNPFSTASSPSQVNPFASLAPTSSLAAKPPQKPSSPPPTESLPETFAEKVRLSSPPPSNPSNPAKVAAGPPLPWPPQSAFPKPYPHHHLDAEYETLSRPPSPTLPTTAQPVLMDEDSSTAAGADPKDTFESAMDKSFLRFSTRLAHNPEQVLRYEFRGTPLLYSTTDVVGKLFSNPSPSAKSSHVKVSTGGGGAGRIPRCEYCGRERVFEVQLTPHAITVLEEGREGIGLGPNDDTGMEWGTVILGVCAANCGLEHEGVLGWREEWVGVQWEERVAGK